MEQQEQATGKAKPGLGRRAIWFGVLWVVAFYLSWCQLHSPVKLGCECADSDFRCVGGAVWNAIVPFGKPTPAPCAEQHSACPANAPDVSHKCATGQAAQAAPIPPAIESRLDAIANGLDARFKSIDETLDKRLHAPQTLAGALLKILVVCALSALWFSTFLFAKPAKEKYLRWCAAELASAGAPPAATKKLWTALSASGITFVIVVIALFPAVVFSLSMYHAYEPAVFVMALVAIYVAAEHYGGLVDTEHELQERTAELKRTLGTVLDADGLNVWRREVYALYRRATWRIDGVVRSLDIDTEWWKCAGKPKPWTKYVEQSKAGSGDFTLLSVMGASRAKVMFAVDLPLPIHAVRPGCPEVQKSKFFRDLLGLAWYLVVFDFALQERQNRAEPNQNIARLRMKLTHAPSWMHVVDYTVYQMIERSALANSTVRELTHNLEDPEERRLLSRWARENVRSFARRGGLAEEYVFSVLRYGAYQMPGADEEGLLKLRDILDILGMKEYLNERNEQFLIVPEGREPREKNLLMLERPHAESLCMAVFERLIEIKLGPAVGRVRLQDLIRELL